MIKKVIYITENQFNQRDYDRFGVDILKKNGFKVEIWSMIRLLYDGRKLQNMHVEGPLTVDDGYYVLKDYDDLIEKLKKQNRATTCVVSLIHRPDMYFISHKLYLMMNFLRIKYVFVPEGDPVILRRSDHVYKTEEKIYHKFSSIFIFRPKMKFLSTDEDNPKVFCNTNKTVYIHCTDYDIHLKSRKAPESEWAGKNYAVFIDAYYPFHPEYKFMNQKSPINDVDRYYKELCDFFSFLEEQYNTKVIIAVHPRGNYRDKKDYFQGREIVYGKTRELVEHAKLVMSYESTAVNFVVIYKKPWIHITHNDVLKNVENGPWVEAMARFFGRNPINLSKDYNKEMVSEHLTVDKKKYLQFKRTYIKKKGTPNRRFFQVVADYLKTL